MVDIEKKAKALRLNWVKRMITQKGTWISYLEYLIKNKKMDINTVIKCKTQFCKSDSLFYNSLFKDWNELIGEHNNCIEKILYEKIWFNKNIELSKNCQLWKKMY